MKCACGGESEVLERRGARRRRQCKVCGQRWTTLEVRVGVRPPSLPPALAKLGKQGTQPKIHARYRPRNEEADELDDDSDEFLHTCLPEIFNGQNDR